MWVGTGLCCGVMVRPSSAEASEEMFDRRREKSDTVPRKISVSFALVCNPLISTVLLCIGKEGNRLR